MALCEFESRDELVSQFAELRDLLLLSFAYVFGWRTSTVESLVGDFMHLEADGMVVFTEAFCKGF